MTPYHIEDITHQEFIITYLEELIADNEASGIADNIYFARQLKATLEIEKEALERMKTSIIATEFNV